MKRIGVCVFVVAAALGGCKKSKKGAGPSASPSASPTPSVSPSASASASASASPTASASPGPSASAPAGPQRQILLVGTSGHYLQLGCWDPVTKQIVDGDPCVQASPDKVGVQLLGGGSATTSGKSEEVYCEIEGNPPDKAWGFSIPGAGAEIAVLPKDAPVKLSEPADGGNPTAAQKKAATAAFLATRKDKKPKQIEVSLGPAVDLNGDGKVDVIFHVHGELPGLDEDLPTDVASIMADLGDGKVLELFSESGTPSGRVSIMATVDLGADGATELVVRADWNGGYSIHLVSGSPGPGSGAIGCDS